MSVRWCAIEHEEDQPFRMVMRRTKEIKEIGGRRCSVEGWEWRCPICDAQDILFEYSEEAYPVPCD